MAERKSTQVRFPVEVYRSVKAAAERDHRSFNGQVISLLAQALAIANTSGGKVLQSQ
jgi:hypothetical protein